MGVKQNANSIHCAVFALGCACCTGVFKLLRRLVQLADMATNLALHYSPSDQMFLLLAIVARLPSALHRLHPIIPRCTVCLEMAAISRLGSI